MKKNIYYLPMACGLFLFMPFQLLKLSSIVNISEGNMNALGVIAMIGIIIILLSMLKIVSLIEIKFILKDKSNNSSGFKS